MSLSTLAARSIAGRRFTCSEWTAGHLAATIARLEKEHPTCRLVILQTCYHRGVDSSEGTHDYDGVLDVQITNMDWGKAQSFLRASGWAAWHRTPKQGFSDHVHMATIPPGLSGRPTAAQVGAAYEKLGIKVGKYIDGGWTTSDPHRITATCQIADYFAHAYGLAGAHTSGADRSWFPADIAKTIYSPGGAVAKPVTTPFAHRHLLANWNNNHEVTLHDVSLVEKTDRQPYADAAKKLHHGINDLFAQYEADTK